MVEKPTIRHPCDIRHLREETHFRQTSGFVQLTIANSQPSITLSRCHLRQ